LIVPALLPRALRLADALIGHAGVGPGAPAARATAAVVTALLAVTISDTACDAGIVRADLALGTGPAGAATAVVTALLVVTTPDALADSGYTVEGEGAGPAGAAAPVVSTGLPGTNRHTGA